MEETDHPVCGLLLSLELNILFRDLSLRHLPDKKGSKPHLRFLLGLRLDHALQFISWKLFL